MLEDSHELKPGQNTWDALSADAIQEGLDAIDRFGVEFFHDFVRSFLFTKSLHALLEVTQGLYVGAFAIGPLANEEILKLR